METEKNNKKERRQIQLQKKRERSRSSRMNETEEQRQIRLQKDKERVRSKRMNETAEQLQIRLQKEKERSRSNRMNETEQHQKNRLDQQKKRSEANRTKKKHEIISGEQDSIRSPWPEPISRDLKEARLQQFLEQMSMKQLAEATCAVCNIRTPAKDSKKIPISKIPNMDLLKVSEDLKTLIKNSMKNTATHTDDSNIRTTSHIKSM
jgi:hypothetical protein